MEVAVALPSPPLAVPISVSASASGATRRELKSLQECSSNNLEFERSGLYSHFSNTSENEDEEGENNLPHPSWKRRRLTGPIYPCSVSPSLLVLAAHQPFSFPSPKTAVVPPPPSQDVLPLGEISFNTPAGGGNKRRRTRPVPKTPITDQTLRLAVAGGVLPHDVRKWPAKNSRRLSSSTQLLLRERYVLRVPRGGAQPSATLLAALLQRRLLKEKGGGKDHGSVAEA
jgi:hypothetical protein